VKTLTVTEVARRFSSVLDDVEQNQEEIVLVRNHRPVARLIPEAPAKDALSVLGDLHRTLDDETADALLAAIAKTRRGKAGKVSKLRNPWGS
jgi:prevent-host-death family protein